MQGKRPFNYKELTGRPGPGGHRGCYLIASDKDSKHASEYVTSQLRKEKKRIRAAILDKNKTTYMNTLAAPVFGIVGYVVEDPDNPNHASYYDLNEDACHVDDWHSFARYITARTLEEMSRNGASTQRRRRNE